MLHIDLSWYLVFYVNGRFEYEISNHVRLVSGPGSLFIFLFSEFTFQVIQFLLFFRIVFLSTMLVVRVLSQQIFFSNFLAEKNLLKRFQQFLGFGLISSPHSNFKDFFMKSAVFSLLPAFLALPALS